MLTIVERAIHLKIEGDQKELAELIEATKFRPPNYWRADSYQIYQSTHGERGWDGYLRIVELPDRKITRSKGRCLRGHQDTILDVCQTLNIKVDFQAIRSPFEGIEPDDIPDNIVKADFQLDEHQKTCVASWLHHAHGVHRMVTSAGKTITFAAAAAMIKRRFPESRFLYTTPTERLVNQVFREMHKFLPDWNITQFGGGKRDNTGTDMVVATVASIHRNYKELAKSGWLMTFMTVLLDESHHFSSESGQKLLMSMPSYFRLGASDTTREDDPVAFSRIHGLIGPIRERIEANPLILVGRIAKPTIHIVDVDEWTGLFKDYDHAAILDSPAWALIDNEWKSGIYLGPVYESATPNAKGEFKEGEEDGLKKDKKGEPIVVENLHKIQVDKEELEIESRWCLLDRVHDKAIVQFKDRNNLIAEWAEYFSKQNLPTLVVATRTLHVLILQAVIAARVGQDKVRILFSTHTTKERDETFEWLTTTPGAVLVSPLVKEGVNIPELASGIIADHVVNHEVMTQIIGRFIRKKPSGDNVAKVVMFLDRQHPRLRKNGMRLIEKLEKIRGFDFISPVQGPKTISQGLLYKSVDALAPSEMIV